ncbi:integral membrane protein S linking to the trans Golgi network-domain-containing protein [Epithele typhae]|uniref:integral membrane protein S linking to the trans Golgi network-domain-containing protein n=1 Tax=Epithele typhae TaxID=378194 RepID=UPI0020076BFF|nr:integral membrane protein S linking to the trans Golgi network-domain-containing protein [Epithele typhae]KAH9913085.1 integral membrane protein S linking to the trans Golgi network-domain-containing protein [Epithele typhae]
MAKPTGWDPVLILSQILALQTLHYLSLSLLVPPLLVIFADPTSLEYEGGAANVGMILDWREMAGRPTTRALPGEGPWSAWNAVWSGGRQVGLGSAQQGGLRSFDPVRCWLIVACWLVASVADVYCLYALVRRPRLVLDFALTLLFVHLVLTTYYTAAFPTSVFFWLVVGASTAGTVIFAEQLCVKREMDEGLVVTAPTDNGEDNVEMGHLLRQD